MPKTKNGGFILDDSELAPYGRTEKKKIKAQETKRTMKDNPERKKKQ